MPYLMIVHNSVEEETKGRISLGIKAFFANQDLFKINYCPRNPSYGCTKY
jgi:hypothetical protein